MGKPIRKLRRPARAYAPATVSASSHPTRQAILKALKSGPITTMQLEDATGETRYNLYHHLTVLEETGLVRHRLKGKIKEYRLATKRKPSAMYYQVDADDMFTDRKKFDRFLRALSDLVNEDIPQKKKVQKISISVSYPWSKD